MIVHFASELNDFLNALGNLYDEEDDIYSGEFIVRVGSIDNIHYGIIIKEVYLKFNHIQIVSYIYGDMDGNEDLARYLRLNIGNMSANFEKESNKVWIWWEANEPHSYAISPPVEKPFENIAEEIKPIYENALSIIAGIKLFASQYENTANT